MAHEVAVIITEALIALLVFALTKYLIPWLKNHTSNELIAFITTWVAEAVKAAEQTHGANEGKIKKEEVLVFVNQVLEAHNIEISAEELDILIESAVKKLHIELLQASSN